MQTLRSVYRTLGIALLGMALIGASARAQNIFGAIVGTVSDPGGAVLAGANVTVTNLETGEKRTATTSGSGDYQILSLPRGEYKIEVDSPGFKHFARTPIDVVVDQQARVNVTMVIGEQNQQVYVTGAPPIMQTESASLGQAIEGKAVQTLPLNGRNVLNLVSLVPGVVPQGGASTNLSGQNVFAAGNYQIEGGNANQGAVLVDGASVNTLYGNAVELVMDQDSIQEFNAQTHNNTAEFGDYNGGVINMSTKSGTNAFHGEAYEYVRNTLFDANDFFANREGKGRQAWHQNQFGGNVGGPIRHNKYFFFGAYQGYRQTNGQPILATLPTAAELTGDFSAISAPIYDPLTTCGTSGNPACTPAQQNGTAPTRQQFSYNGLANVIPPNRMSAVAKNLIAFPIYGKPNVPGTMTPEGPVNNFFSLSTAGGTNDQFTIRGDQNLTAKQTAFERYTRWNSKNIDPKPFEPYNNLYYIALAPEAFTTHQLVVGDTYVFNAASVADVHLSYLRWNYTRIPTNLGINESQAFGWPGYMDFGSLNNLPKSTSVPAINTSGPISYYQGQAGYIFSINNNYAIASTYQRIWKRHTFKFGLELRRWDMNYFQNNQPGGNFNFDNVFTAQNVANPGTTGNALASFELGYSANGSVVQVSPPVYQRLYYQGYFGQDTWQLTNKLTATLGLRWEVPGTFLAGHGWEDTFNPTEINPVVGIPGAFDLVNSPQHRASGAMNENWNNWEPRLGIAYRVTNSTVLRAGWGKYVTPVGLAFYSEPLQAGINFLSNPMVNSVDGQETPSNTLDDPFPNGLLTPPHRNPNYQQILLGGSPQAVTANQPSGETYQWNVSVEHQFPTNIAVTATYAGLLGDNLPLVLQLNALPDSVLSQAASDPACSSGNLGSCFLNQQVPNPFYPKITQGVLKNPTVTQNQLLRPFPQYGGLGNSGANSGTSDYNAFELKVQKQMGNAGMLLGSYTFSRLMTNAEYLDSWLDGIVGLNTAGWQDYNNPGSEYSLSSFDARQRLVVSYIYQLPVGKGRMFLNKMSAPVNAILGGWGLEGITTFQKGFPLGFSVTPNILSTYAFQGTERPNVSAGCGKAYSGSIGSRLGGAGSAKTYFNKSCFTVPADFSYGNEPRTDNTLRTPGIDNWDMSLFKDFPVHENMTLNFRVEAFNLFNRVQFGSPNTQLGNAQFGWITQQGNNPRLLQLSGRFSF
jgi:outer membrane receptor protein involved in Fe transport